MRDSHLDWIWSRYNTSPDPASGMQSLYQTCLVFTKHVLQPSHIILRGGGFVLHPELAIPLTDIITSMDHLLYLAAKHIQLHSAPYMGQQQLRILTTTEGLHTCATQNQIVYGWVTLTDRLARAMHELQWLCIGEDPSRYNWSSWMPGILASLPPSLRSKLPNDFLESNGIMVLPPAANTSDVARQKADRKHVESLSPSFTCRSHVCPSDVEAGGLASPQKIGASCSPPKLASEATVNCDMKSTTIKVKGSGYTPRQRSLSSAVKSATVNFTCIDTSMSELVDKFTSYPTPDVSLLARTECIVKIQSLGSLDITDRGIDSALGRFGLETGFLRRVNNTVDEMQSVLTTAFSLIHGLSTCFLVDPHNAMLRSLRGASSVEQLRVVWAGLSRRMAMAQTRFTEYQQQYQTETEGNSPIDRGVLDPARSTMTSLAERCTGSAVTTRMVAVSDDAATPAAPASLPLSSKSPAPALANADAVELGGLDIEKEESRGRGTTVKHGGLREDGEKRCGSDDKTYKYTSGLASPTTCLAPAPAVIKDWLPKEPASAQDQRRATSASSETRTKMCFLDTRSPLYSIPVTPGCSAATSPLEPQPLAPGDITDVLVDKPAIEYDVPSEDLQASATPAVHLPCRRSLTTRNLHQVPGTPSARLTANALATTRIPPSSKSPAPVFANADVVELGGLRVGVAEPRAKASAVERGGHAQGTAENGRLHVERGEAFANTSVVELGGLKQCGGQLLRSASNAEVQTFKNSAGADDMVAATSGTSACEIEAAAPGLINSEVELVGLQVLLSSQAKLDGKLGLRTCDEDGRPPVRRGCKTRASHSSFPALPPSSLVSLYLASDKTFALVSAIVRPKSESYLACSHRGELAPYLAWAREGIGTARAIS
ncbi:hypothetical protein C8R47DRAFT_1326348 [Mycena vitilis]|nr:hypothetical protein C8R47DRAFT_1326348 [Mycena vitilis]